MRLSELQTGEKGVIIKVYGHGGFRKRIVEMGFVKGKMVEVLLNAPLKDPVKYRIMGYEISLRHEEAQMIEVISEQEAKEQQSLLMQYHGSMNETVAISEEEMQRIALGKRRTINVALIGNPNCGKTSLFNLASGAHEHVGNYSGVTVDAKEGFFDFQDYHFKIVDLPGTYSMSTYSPEELYVRRYIIEETPDVIINVVDASNLERNLYLTTQLIDMNVRMVVALNMYDELEASGNTLDHRLLSKLFGIPMVPTVCKRNQGIDHLFHIIINMYEGVDFINEQGVMHPEVLKELQDWHRTNVDDSTHEEHFEDFVREGPVKESVYRHIHVNHGPDIENAILAIKKELEADEMIRHKYSLRYLSIKLLEKDKEVETFVRTLSNGEQVLKSQQKEIRNIRLSLNEESDTAITNAKYGFITGALKETFIDNHLEKQQVTKVLDSIVTHRIWGFPIFFIFMWIMFQSTFSLGQYPMDLIKSMVQMMGHFVHNSMSPGPLKDMLADGIIGGVGGVIVFLPQILILYFFISLMEDTGYMARAAFIMDKIMHKMGLHGKSFIPLIMGFGCNVPAIMATRTIESRKSRLVTILINPLMSCSARLPIYLLLAGVFFPDHAGAILLIIYSTGILLAVLMARLFSRFLVKGKDMPFVMELPPYRMPTSRSIIRHTWEKGKQYIKKMGGIIMVASIIIWFLGYYPNHNGYETAAAQQESSYIGQIGKMIEPAIRPMGFDWKLGIGLISGAGAKELVASTLCVLYANNDDPEATDFARHVVSAGVTPLAAFCYMLFVLIYFPCIATLAAIKQESGSWKWALFSAVYTVVLAWIVSFIVYQLGSLLL
ncbi:MAG TPA: ferrous iron transport protein B [Bacteroidales bacterium]